MKHILLAFATILSVSSLAHAYEWQNPTKITPEGKNALLVSAASQNLLTGADTANKSLCFNVGTQIGYNRALLERAKAIQASEKSSAAEVKEADEAIVTLNAKINAQSSMVAFCTKNSI